MNQKPHEELRDEQVEQAVGGISNPMFDGLDVKQMIEKPIAAADEARQELSAEVEKFMEDVPTRKIETRTFSFSHRGGLTKGND